MLEYISYFTPEKDNSYIEHFLHCINADRSGVFKPSAHRSWKDITSIMIMASAILDDEEEFTAIELE